MTREEKQKAIDTLKISSPFVAVTQEEYNDYIQTINQIIDWLEQEPRKGHWVEHNTPNNTHYYDCSLCGCVAHCTEFADSYLWKLSNFCPDCGAEMKVSGRYVEYSRI